MEIKNFTEKNPQYYSNILKMKIKINICDYLVRFILVDLLF